MPPTDINIERGLPASLEAERSILGAILLDSLLYDQAAELSPDDFSLDGHRRIFDCMRMLSEMNVTVDMITLAEELDRTKQIEAVGGVSYLSGLIDGVPERPSIEHYVNIVRGKALLRGLINISQNAIAEAIDHSDEAQTVLERAEEGLLLLAESSAVGQQFHRIGESVAAAGGLDAYLDRMIDPIALTGLATGFVDLDDLVRLRKKELFLLAARPSMGKTAAALCIAERLLRTDSEMVVPFFSLEMSCETLHERLLQSIARVSINRIRKSGTPYFEDKQKLAKALEWLADKQLLIDDVPRLTPARLRSKVRRAKRKHGRLDLVIVDYVQLMSSGKKMENRTQEVSEISRGLKAVAKDLDCPILACCIVSRSAEGRSEKRPVLADLKESGQLEQDADVVAFLHRPEVYDPKPELKGLCEVIIAKQRNGPVGECKLAFLSEYTRFEDLTHG